MGGGSWGLTSSAAKGGFLRTHLVALHPQLVPSCARTPQGKSCSGVKSPHGELLPPHTRHGAGSGTAQPHREKILEEAVLAGQPCSAPGCCPRERWPIPADPGVLGPRVQTRVTPEATLAPQRPAQSPHRHAHPCTPLHTLGTHPQQWVQLPAPMLPLQHPPPHPCWRTQACTSPLACMLSGRSGRGGIQAVHYKYKFY